MAGSEHIMQSLINLIYRLFICRTDRYGIQWCRDGEVGYRAEKGEITRQLLREHLEGRKTIGIYSTPPGTTKWLVFDFDSMDLAPVKKLQAVLGEKGIPAYIEFSGSKGWHLWVFFKQMHPNTPVRSAGRMLLECAGLKGVEIFPKQDTVSVERPGNLIKLPLGIHQATGKRCVFVEAEHRPHKDQLSFMLEVEKTSIENFQKMLKVSGLKPEASAPHKCRINNTPRQLKPCVEALLCSGTDEGYRNRAGFLIASELRRISAPKAVAAGALSTWNLRNNPPLRRDELHQILCSAYSQETRYEFGCKWEGILDEIMPAFCVGKSSCLYLDVLKELNSKVKTSNRR